MKLKSIAKVFGLALGLAASASAWAIPVSTVGAYDEIVDRDTLDNSGEATELDWANRLVGGLTLIDKIDTNASDWTLVEGTTSVYALFLNGYTPDYFLVKTGKNKASLFRNFFYENYAELGYAVIDLVEAGIDNIGKVSHVTLFKGEGTVTVSEPASLALLGIALTGLAAARRRRQ